MTDVMALPHHLERTLRIRAPRETVFRYFTDSRRWATWWGPGSRIDPVPGGEMLIRYPNGVEAAGNVVSVDPPARIVFTYGYASGQPIPPGASRVTVALESLADGTLLTLRHEFSEAAVRDQHTQGWRYQLSVFANVVSDDVHERAAARVDEWFGIWVEPDAATRAATLRALAAPGVTFRDRYSVVEGVDDLLPHIEATQRFMPGVRVARDGAVRRCQDTALADWIASGPDGAPRGRGTNVFTFGADGRIEAVVGVWAGAVNAQASASPSET